MKNGQTPIHIQRWAPADYLADEHVKLLQARRDYLTIAFYRHFIDTSFVAGGDLPADPEMLAAVVSMPRKDVERALAFCVGRLIQPDGDRLYQPRVRREIAEELEFREIQRANGAKGGRRATQRLALPTADPAAKDSPSPPAPFAFRLSPAPIATAPEEAPEKTPTPSAPLLDLDLPEAKAAPVKKLSPQQEFIDSAWKTYDDVGAMRPPAALLAKWARDYFKGNYAWMLRSLAEMAPRGALSKGDAYVGTALKNIAEGKSFAPGKPVDERQWVPVGTLDEDL